MSYKYVFPLFLINSFDNDDIKSSKRHVFLVSLIFLLKKVLGMKKKNDIAISAGTKPLFDDANYDLFYVLEDNDSMNVLSRCSFTLGNISINYIPHCRAVARLQNKTRQVSSAEGASRKRRLGAYTPDNFEI